jgi:hypothetical protein
VMMIVELGMIRSVMRMVESGMIRSVRGGPYEGEWEDLKTGFVSRRPSAIAVVCAYMTLSRLEGSPGPWRWSSRPDACNALELYSTFAVDSVCVCVCVRAEWERAGGVHGRGLLLPHPLLPPGRVDE